MTCIYESNDEKLQEVKHLQDATSKSYKKFAIGIFNDNEDDYEISEETFKAVEAYQAAELKYLQSKFFQGNKFKEI